VFYGTISGSSYLIHNVLDIKIYDQVTVFNTLEREVPNTFKCSYLLAVKLISYSQSVTLTYTAAPYQYNSQIGLSAAIHILSSLTTIEAIDLTSNISNVSDLPTFISAVCNYKEFNNLPLLRDELIAYISSISEPTNLSSIASKFTGHNWKSRWFKYLLLSDIPYFCKLNSNLINNFDLQ
jgi:hypothetical protein